MNCAAVCTSHALLDVLTPFFRYAPRLTLLCSRNCLAPSKFFSPAADLGLPHAIFASLRLSVSLGNTLDLILLLDGETVLVVVGGVDELIG